MLSVQGFNLRIYGRDLTINIDICIKLSANNSVIISICINITYFEQNGLVSSSQQIANSKGWAKLWSETVVRN